MTGGADPGAQFQSEGAPLRLGAASHHRGSRLAPL